MLHECSPTQAHAAVERGASFVDVRERNEYALGYAQDARCIPRAELLGQLLTEHSSKQQAWVLICQSGVRSRAAAQSLLDAGFVNVLTVQGGFNQWRIDGLPWVQTSSLSAEELTRYSRQMLLPEFGSTAQLALKNAKVLLIGAGGLGSPCALYLAAAGVGMLGIADGDQLDLSNLHRQVLHRSDGLGQAKTASAKRQLHALNPLVEVLALPAIDASNVDPLLAEFDWIIDGSDNFPTRFLIADACVRLAKPLIYGAVLRFDGQASVFRGSSDPTGSSPCYRCLFPEPPPPESSPSCAQAGVLGVLPGLVGTLQATEAIKLITGIGESLSGRLLLIDAKSMRFREIKIARDPACPGCGPRPNSAS